ncbi:UNVERIFIED_CONTAM: putative glucan endo-1,3-beta-glucosidase A6 [Sesamum radiatum]|uniref:Glucan endo-1,3-beta-glucosidase A6 n=1 Tax=Sesamum radiatum TaxID=300843 RepID=A0AAW2UKQ2_SESRA
MVISRRRFHQLLLCLYPKVKAEEYPKRKSIDISTNTIHLLKKKQKKERANPSTSWVSLLLSLCCLFSLSRLLSHVEKCNQKSESATASWATISPPHQNPFNSSKNSTANGSKSTGPTPKSSNQYKAPTSKSQSWSPTTSFPTSPPTKHSPINGSKPMLSPSTRSPRSVTSSSAMKSSATHWFKLVPAMRKIRSSVKKFGLHKIKVGTPLAMDALESSFPPSNGTFRSDVREKVIKPMLHFLNRTKSFFFVDVYTYFAWVSQPLQINLDYALLQPTNITYTDPVSGLTYTNLLDQMLDALVFAMKRLGYPDIRLFLAETGWPSGGDPDQLGANIYNAATYNRNVVKKFMAKPPIGTPARPGAVIPAMIFALYNENQKPGPGTERNFGLLYPNGTHVYPIDLSGKTQVSEYPPLAKPANNGKLWCVVAEGANKTALTGALSYACSQGNRTCDPIQPGGKCYKPNSLIKHASYAFSSYWAQMRAAGATCFFNGLAVMTSKDPSYGACKFPSVNL